MAGVKLILSDVEERAFSWYFNLSLRNVLINLNVLCLRAKHCVSFHFYSRRMRPYAFSLESIALKQVISEVLLVIFQAIACDLCDYMTEVMGHA